VSQTQPIDNALSGKVSTSRSDQRFKTFNQQSEDKSHTVTNDTRMRQASRCQQIRPRRIGRPRLTHPKAFAVAVGNCRRPLLIRLGPVICARHSLSEFLRACCSSVNHKCLCVGQVEVGRKTYVSLLHRDYINGIEISFDFFPLPSSSLSHYLFAPK
jgi:hypothetical protein